MSEDPGRRRSAWAYYKRKRRSKVSVILAMGLGWGTGALLLGTSFGRTVFQVAVVMLFAFLGAVIRGDLLDGSGDD